MKKIIRYLFASFFIIAGLNHFFMPDFYLDLIPPYIPFHDLVNFVSGFIEVGLGAMLFYKGTQYVASIGIMLLMVAFIPAHIYFIQMGNCIEGGLCVPDWVGWARLLVIHPILIYTAYYLRK